MKRKPVTWILVALGLAAACAVAFFAWRAVAEARPGVSERWTIYVERLKPEKKLVVLSSAQRYAASKEFTAKLLALVKVSATIELSVWADVFYFVDISDPSLWTIAWDKKTRRLTLAAPAPDCLPPAVRTDSIEINAKGANLVTNAVFRLKEEAKKMETGLSADLLVRARASLADETVRAGIREGIAGIGRGFCAAVLGIEPREVTVRLPGD
jgi:hypothetical protein